MIISLKTISFIKCNCLRIGRHNFDIKNVFKITHHSFHQLITNMMSLICRVYQKIVQECNCFAIIERPYKSNQRIAIPRRKHMSGILHRPNKFIGVIS